MSKATKEEILAFILEKNTDSVLEIREAFEKEKGIKIGYRDIYPILKNKDKLQITSTPVINESEIETVFDKNGLPFNVFKEATPLIDATLLKGVQLEVAGVEGYFVLEKTHYKGEPQWPNSNGYTLRDSNGMIRCFEQAQCRLAKNQSKK